MDAQELKELCQRVARKNKTTAAEKEIIRKEAQSRGIELNTRCTMCFVDAAVAIFQAITTDERVAEINSEREKKYILRDGVDVLFGGIRINAATLTDTLAEVIVSRGFELKWFKKHPGV